MQADALSDVLKTVRMTGAVFYNVTARAPWVAEQLSSEAVLPLVLPGADHIIAYHIITEGRCFSNIIGKDEPVELRAGQTNTPCRAAQECAESQFQATPWRALRLRKCHSLRPRAVSARPPK